MTFELILFGLGALGAIAVLIFAVVIMIGKFYRKVEQGKALVVNKMKRDPSVTFTGDFVLPVIHKAEVMDISVKTIEIDRRGKEGLICQDNIRADIKVTFFVRVNKRVEDVIKVAQSIGCARASSPETLDELFSAKFSEALKTVGKQLDFEDLYTKRDDFRDAIIQIIGRDLNGYVLEDAAIDYLEQTPLESLDPQNILDAQGIRKITQLTAEEHVRTNEFENTEKKAITKQDVERAKVILELEREEADAESKQKREIESVRAREGAELMQVQAEERLKSENARIKTDEEVQVAEAEQAPASPSRREEPRARHRRRDRARRKGPAARSRLTASAKSSSMRIDKEKALEVERKAIQDVIRERVAVERTVVEEQERIKELQVVEEAKRTQGSGDHFRRGRSAREARQRHQSGRSARAVREAHCGRAHHDGRRPARSRRPRSARRRSVSLKVPRPNRRPKASPPRRSKKPTPSRPKSTVSPKSVSGKPTQQPWRKSGRRKRRSSARKAQRKATRSKRSSPPRRERHCSRRLEAMRALDEAAAPARGVPAAYREREAPRDSRPFERARPWPSTRLKILSEALETADIDIVGGDGAFLDRMVNSIGMGKAVDEFVDESDVVSDSREGLLERQPQHHPGDQNGDVGGRHRRWHPQGHHHRCSADEARHRHPRRRSREAEEAPAASQSTRSRRRTPLIGSR